MVKLKLPWPDVLQVSTTVAVHSRQKNKVPPELKLPDPPPAVFTFPVTLGFSQVVE